MSDQDHERTNREIEDLYIDERGLWYCPKCGEPTAAPSSLLGHIYTNHEIVNKDD